MRGRRIASIAALLVIVGALVATVRMPGKALAFVSPLPPICPKGERCGDGYLPWRPTPPAKEAKEQPSVDVAAARRGECIVRARAWSVPEGICR